MEQKPKQIPNQKGMIGSFLHRIEHWLHPDKSGLDEVVDYAVNTIEPRLKQVRGYRKRLEAPLEICLAHCHHVVEAIPGPIYLKKSHYRDDPFIRAAFPGKQRIEPLLEKTEQSDGGLFGHGRVALLTMLSREKTVFGRKQQGNLIVGETAMRSITFTEHSLVGLASTLSESKKALERYCLEVIVEAVARELSEIRTRLVDLRQRKERLRAMSRLFGDQNTVDMGCVFVPYDPERAQKRHKVEQMMAETERELEAAAEESETPKSWLNIVEDILSRPEDILSIHQVSLRLNWSNILTDDPEQKANTINFATFTLGEEMQREGVLIAYQQV